ncbi:MAG: anthranilate synthase component 1 [Chthoniobacterales bacterium]|nr:anthranilate synthase component 1 [Chthoniobacterales bacterium]
MSVAQQLAAGEVIPLVRSISAAPDALDLFAQLCAGGTKPDTLLLESGDVEHRRSEKSLLVLSSALRINCRGREVVVAALNWNGRSLLPWLARELREFVTSEEGDAVRLLFPPPERADEEARLRQASPVDVLRRLLARLKTTSASSAHLPLVAGVFSYDFVGSFESLPAPASDALEWPDYEFWLPDRLVWIFHKQRSLSILAHVFGGEYHEQSYHDAAGAVAELARICANEGNPATVDSKQSAKFAPEADLEISDAEFGDLVLNLKEHVAAGDVFQIVASRTFWLACPNPVASYRHLRAINPSPYMFFVNGTRGILFGSSPETAVRVDGTPRRVEIRPIAGTRHRGFDTNGEIDADLDARMEADLRLDEKEVAEHMMLVDLARNDVARVSIAGTRTVDRLLSVERFSHVMHLVSHVSGRLRPELDALHAYVASMNMGTLVGAPKLKAAELLRRHERSARGPYGGAVGYLTADGRMDTCIVIRSAVVRDGIAHVRAGAGIVADSDPQAETMETRRKAEAVLRAVAAGRDAP